MTGLKDTYKLREENYLGKAGPLQMEVNAVNNQVQNTPAFHPTHIPTQNVPITLARECEDKLNHLGNCYSCNSSPGHLKRNCPEGKSTQTQARNGENRRARKEAICYNCNKPGHYSRNCRGPKKNYKHNNPQEQEDRIMKRVQEMLVKSNSKPEDFHRRGWLQDKPL